MDGTYDTAYIGSLFLSSAGIDKNLLELNLVSNANVQEVECYLSSICAKKHILRLVMVSDDIQEANCVYLILCVMLRKEDFQKSDLFNGILEENSL